MKKKKILAVCWDLKDPPYLTNAKYAQHELYQLRQWAKGMNMGFYYIS